MFLRNKNYYKMNIELQLREELLLKNKEISLLLTHCKKLQDDEVNFNEMNKLLYELEETLKENVLYQQYIIHYNEENEYNPLKLIIQWYKNEHLKYQLALTNKDDEIVNILDNMEEILINKDKEIKHLEDLLQCKDVTIDIINNKLKEDQQAEINLLNEQLIDTNFVVYNHEKLIKTQQKYTQQLEYDKNNLNDLVIDKDVELYNLYTEEEHLRDELKEEVNKYEEELKANEKLNVENKNLNKQIEELTTLNKQYIDLISNIQIFISEAQESKYIPLFNPIRIMDNIITLFNRNLCCDFEVKKNYIQTCNRC